MLHRTRKRKSFKLAEGEEEQSSKVLRSQKKISGAQAMPEMGADHQQSEGPPGSQGHASFRASTRSCSGKSDSTRLLTHTHL